MGSPGHLRLLLSALLLASASAGCASAPRPISDRILALRSPHEQDRAEAAASLRLEPGVPNTAIVPLLEALAVEGDDLAFKQILLTLGQSGAPGALPWLEYALRDPARHELGREALKRWLLATGRIRKGDPY